MEMPLVHIPRPLSAPIGVHLTSFVIQGPFADAALSLPAGVLGCLQQLVLLTMTGGSEQTQLVKCLSQARHLKTLVMTGPVMLDLDIDCNVLQELVIIDTRILSTPGMQDLTFLRRLTVQDIGSLPPATFDVSLPHLTNLHVGMRGAKAHLLHLFFKRVHTPRLSSLVLELDWLLSTIVLTTICQSLAELSTLHTMSLSGHNFEECRLERLAAATTHLRLLYVPTQHISDIQRLIAHGLWCNVEHRALSTSGGVRDVEREG